MGVVRSLRGPEGWESSVWRERGRQENKNVIQHF